MLKNRQRFFLLISLVVNSCTKTDNLSKTKEIINSGEKTSLSSLSATESRLSNLPKSGRAAIRPWNGFYWPYAKGGMFRRVLGEKSPMEKWAAVFPTSPLLEPDRAEKTPSGEWWFGFCNSVAEASVTVPEPLEVVTYKNVAFYPHDVKAIYARIFSRLATSKPPVLVGTRNLHSSSPVDNNGRPTELEARDLNPGSFHILLANQLGNLKKPILMDIRDDDVVLIFPAFQFSSQIVGPVTDKKTLKLLRKYASSEAKNFFEVKTQVEFSDSHLTLVSNPKNLNTVKASYFYYLETDREGKIVGGEWKKNTAHPDFIYYRDLTGWERTAGGIELTELLTKGLKAQYDPSKHLQHPDAIQKL